MKTIVQDPEAFFADGGWNFLLSGSDDEEGDEESEESEFEPSDSGTGSEYEDSSGDEGSVVEETESGEYIFNDYIDFKHNFF